MPRGVQGKREKEFKELEHKFQKSGRYKGRQEEVAARIVNKQRARFGETKGAHQKSQKGESPDRDLPIRNYQHLTVDEVSKKLNRLSDSDLRKVQNYEKSHKNRKSLLQEIDRVLH